MWWPSKPKMAWIPHPSSVKSQGGERWQQVGKQVFGKLSWGLSLGPTYPLGTVLKAHNTCRGPWLCLKIFLIRREQWIQSRLDYICLTNSFITDSYKIHFNILFLKKCGEVHKGKSAEGPWTSMMQPWPSSHSINNDANGPPLFPPPRGQICSSETDICS